MLTKNAEPPDGGSSLGDAAETGGCRPSGASHPTAVAATPLRALWPITASRAMQVSRAGGHSPPLRHLRGGRRRRAARRRAGGPGGPAFPLARVRGPGVADPSGALLPLPERSLDRNLTFPPPRLYERGPVVNPLLCFGGTERVCERVSPAGMDAGGARAGWVASEPRERGWGSRLQQCPCLYRFIDFEDQVLSGLAPAAQVKIGLSGSQANNGACRSEGLVTSQHVPDRLGQLSREVDLSDLGAALAA